MTTPDEQTVDLVAAAMWRAETHDSGTPESVTNARTPEAFEQQLLELRAKWHKFARAAISAMPDTKALECDMMCNQLSDSERRRENQKKTIIYQREENAALQARINELEAQVSKARTDAIIAALPDMVLPLVWDQIDAVTLGATSALGFTYTVWAIDGFGYVKFPGTPCGERFAGGIEAAKSAAQAHCVATSLSAFGVHGGEA